MRTSELRAGVVIFSLVFVVAFVLCMWGVYYGVRTVNRARHSPMWPSVQGRIISSRLIPNKRGYTPDVTYLYVVNGVTYSGDTIVLGGFFGRGESRRSADVVSQYKAGNQVRVFYQPESPDVSCLEPGLFGWSIYLTAPLCGLLGLFALMYLRSILRSA